MTLRSDLRVDPSTLGMSIQIPVANYPGRAGTSVPLLLSYNSKVWRIEFDDWVNGNLSNCFNPPDDEVGLECYTTTRAMYGERSVAGWTFSSPFPTIEDGGERFNSNGGACCTGDPNQGFYIARLTVRFADGSTHALRRSDSVLSGADSLTGTYYAVDSSRLKFVGISPGAGTLYLPDGSHYDFSSWSATRYVDRNGNTLEGQLDTLGRQLITPSFHNGFVHTETHAISGVNGVPLNYIFELQQLASLLEPDMATGLIPALRRDGDMDKFGNNIYSPALFNSVPGSRVINTGFFNPVVLHRITLPNGTAYTFTYNEYGEMAKVVYPTGGYERFRYDFVIPLATISEPYSQANRGVVERRISASGTGSDEVTWQYSSTGTGVATTSPDGASTVRLLHTGYAFGAAVFGFDDPRAGMIYEERVYAPQSQGGAMLRRTLTKWDYTGPTTGGQATAKRDPRVSKRIDIVLDTGSNALAAATEMTYDSDLNLISTRHYDHVSVSPATGQTSDILSIPNGPLVRTEETDYLTNDPNYRARNLTSLPTAMRVRNAAGNVVAQSSINYDEAAFPLLTYGAVTGWSDPGTSVRGLPTTIKTWLDTNSSWLQTHAQYDQCGSPIKSWDPKGNLSQVGYSSTYAFAYPTLTLSPVPDPTGAYGSTTAFSTTTNYDFNTGLILSTIDANAQTTSYDYTDPLNRLKQVTLPDGGRTTYIYVDAHQCGPYVETRTLLDSTGRETDSWQFFDGLGRPYLSESRENQDTNNPYIRVDTQYDSMGRAWRVSNPYRSPGCTSTVNPSGRWTQTMFDGLGRPTQIKTTADNAVVTTSYSGNTVTVTDQAGKKRRSLTDALGRLVRVDEPNKDTGNLDVGGASTSYTYDALGNLRKVDQGGQQRFFMYDSLSRLIRAKNPEQGNFTADAAGGFPALTDVSSGTPNSLWSMGYLYDANGNLTKRIDARNVSTTYAYDALNRNTTVRYTDGTKDIDRHYDGAIKGKGRFWYFNWDASNNTRFDTHLAIDQYDAMGRPLNYRQHFLTSGVASPQFNVTRTYDKAGHVLTQIYPSGHAVNYGYDISGRINSDTGNLGDGVSRTYATSLTYSEFGGLQQEQFGTQTALYHKLHYNVRGQLYDIRLSTVAWATDQWNWNRGAIVDYYATADLTCQTQGCRANSGPDNNGNIRQSQYWIPANDAMTIYNWTEDRYAYDSLNRLKSATEFPGTQAGLGAQSFIQTYDYDRWGNRTINQSQTSTIIPHPNYTADTITNRLIAPAGYTYSYDSAGNQTSDNYTGQGGRTYDAENRLKQAQGSPNNQWQSYTYDADGRRIKRNVNGVETWQVYGMDGELLAEYQSGAAAYLPATEYGYRGGELLTSVSNGDTQRLSRFVTNLYYGAKQRDPDAQELQGGINQLAAAGVVSQSQLLTTASQIVRSLFTSTNYETSPFRSDAQYVTDLYYAYLQRGPDDSGLNFWTGQAAGGVTNRTNMSNAFEASSEFQTLVATLYGTAVSDNERTEHFVNDFYLGAYGRNATATELQQQRDALNTAAAQAQSQVQTQAETFGRSLFAAQVNDASLSNTQYVTNLYEAFLQRGPDAGGLSFWSGQASVGTGRQNVLNAFATCSAFRELSGTLYREANWLVTDQLGTPRMIVNKSGSLASVKRHDYLPFGEELSTGISGRTTTQGYTGDSVRQKFTLKERDIETGLDFFEARYFASTQGRFTSIDPYNIVMERQYATNAKKAESQFTSYLSNPQRWARYTYALNNPLLYTDPHGEDVTIYYRPPREGAGSKEDYGHIFIYVRNDETGESAYFDYVADGYPPTVTYLNNVDQDRINAHASLTIETTADQEQAILGGIKEMQKSSPDYQVSLGTVIKGCESTCTSQSVDLLQRAGINFGGIGGHQPSTVWQSAFAQYSNESLSFQEKSFFRQMITPSPIDSPNFNRPATGVEYGRDPRGQARTLDTRAINNTKLFFRGGKRVER